MNEERFGVRGNTHDGIFFTEYEIPGAEVLGDVKWEKSRQNINLTHVKDKLASMAKSRGATAVQGFQYGQRAHKWYELFVNFKWDSESWFGSGQACRLPEDPT